MTNALFNRFPRVIIMIISSLIVFSVNAETLLERINTSRVAQGLPELPNDVGKTAQMLTAECLNWNIQSSCNLMLKLTPHLSAEQMANAASRVTVPEPSVSGRSGSSYSGGSDRYDCLERCKSGCPEASIHTGAVAATTCKQNCVSQCWR